MEDEGAIPSAAIIWPVRWLALRRGHRAFEYLPGNFAAFCDGAMSAYDA